MSCCFELVLQHYYMLLFYYLFLYSGTKQCFETKTFGKFTLVYIYLKKKFKHLCISPVDY